jgi:hypothetical protein
MSAKKGNRDELLAPEQFPGMNSAFYATRPWSYFAHRQRLLMLAAGASDELTEIARKGIKVGRLKYSAEDEEADPRTAEDRERFVFAESEVLLHHVSETLLRLYLAHEGAPRCPWLEVARVRAAGEFKRMVSERFGDELSAEQRRHRVGEVFFGSAERTAIKPSPAQEQWETSLANIEAFLTHYARHFLDADIYNALKHGLAVRPGPAAMQLDEGELIKAGGPAIEYLTLGENSEGKRRWFHTTHWIEVDRALAFISIGQRLMESIWTLARFRYLGERPESLVAWTKPEYAEIMRHLHDGQKSGIFTDRMHMELLYYAPPEEAPEGAETSGTVASEPGPGAP